MSNFVFPTLAEVLRTLLVSIDLKGNNKEIDSFVDKKIYDPREFNEKVDIFLKKPLNDLLDEQGELFIGAIDQFFIAYINIVKKYSVEGLTRRELLPILINSVFKKHIFNFLLTINCLFPGPDIKKFKKTSNSLVVEVLNWFKNYNNTAWNEFYKGLDNSTKDRIYAWRAEGELPSFYYLKIIKNSNYKFKLNLIIWLLVARGVDYLLRNIDEEVVINNLQGDIYEYIESSIESCKSKIYPRIKQEIDALFQISDYLEPDSVKVNLDTNNIKNNIYLIKNSFTYKFIPNYNHIFYFNLARWYVYNGELEQANKMYKYAFEKGMFCAGKDLDKIIEESLVIAASLQKPDNIFIKQLKWAAIIFSDDVSSSFNKHSSNKKEDNIEPWEIAMWRRAFKKLFPQEGWFNAVKLSSFEEDNLSVGQVIVPDYTNPNKKITKPQMILLDKGSYLTFSFLKRKEPQLIYFMILNEYEVVKKLLESNASVNTISEIGDTPILIALKALDRTNTIIDRFCTKTKPSGDHRFFNLISTYQHTEATVNSITQKNRYLPIISAVETGNPDIVKKIIDFGADLNKKGTLDNITALYRCIQIMAMLQNRSCLMQKVKLDPNRLKQVAAACRRKVEGAKGHRLEDYYLDVPEKFYENLFKVELEEYRQKFKYEDMLNIAKILIDNGADPNLKIDIGQLEGYTSLAFAAENDLEELFVYMLDKGGDPRAKHKYIQSGVAISKDCWDVALYWHSEKIIRLKNKV